jgi:hypothetical protein
MRHLLPVLVVLISFFCVLLSFSETNTVKAEPSIAPQPQPTAFGIRKTGIDIKEPIVAIKVLKVDIVNEKIRLEQPNKISQLREDLENAENDLKRLTRTELSPEFSQELKDNLEILSNLKNKEFLDIEDVQQIQDILEDTEIKADPCDPPKETFDITIHAMNGREESVGEFPVYYANAGNKNAKEGNSFAGGASVKTTGKVRKGVKYFWTQDRTNSSRQGKRERRSISCSESKEIFLPIP